MVNFFYIVLTVCISSTIFNMKAIWESPTRYYAAELYQDLLGDWVLVTARGGKSNNIGALRITAVPDEKTGRKQLQALGRLRERHGYLPLSGGLAKTLG